MLRFEVHDVGHGFCATLSGDGYFTVFDCGHKDYPENRPSRFLPAMGCTTINELVIGNFDQDHVSDLPDLQEAVHIASIMRNPSMPPDALRKLKVEGGGVTNAMDIAIRLHETYTHPPPRLPHREKLEFANF